MAQAELDPVIVTDRLSRRFGRVDAVHELSLTVPAGSICGFLGANGAGKTTTLKLLMNLLRPSSGRATVLGVDSQRLGPPQLAQIGYVSENQQLPEWMTVRQLLAYCKPFYPTWDDALCVRLQQLLGLPVDDPKARLHDDAKIRYLSRGMKMKVALVASLAYRPRLLVMDEPFSGLDAAMRDDLIKGVLELAGEDGWSAIISSHDLHEIERLIDRVAFLDRGRLTLSESIATLQARFRRVEITANSAATTALTPPSPDATPATWLALESDASGRALRFVHSGYEGDATERDLLARFPNAQIQTTPLSLRDTFIVLARREGPLFGESLVHVGR